MVKTAQTSLTAFGFPAAFFEMELMCLSSHVYLRHSYCLSRRNCSARLRPEGQSGDRKCLKERLLTKKSSDGKSQVIAVSHEFRFVSTVTVKLVEIVHTRNRQ